MQDSSIVIKLFKNGMEKGPKYSITMNDNGKVIYEGFKNVKITDRIETSIDEDNIVSILENLKESGLFSLNQNYNVDESSGRPFTRIIVDMPGENGQIITKNVSYYDDDFSVPLDLKNFERKTIELTGANSWIIKDFEKPAVKKLDTITKAKKVEIFSNKKNLKIIVLTVSVLVVLSSIYVGFFSGVFSSEDSNSPDLDDDSNGTDDNVDNKVENDPQISFITTTDSSERINGKRSGQKTTFSQGDLVYIDCEVANITHNNNYNFTVMIIVHVGSSTYYNETFHYTGDTSDENLYFINGFLTSDLWPVDDKYGVEVNLSDKISNKSTKVVTFFRLTDADQTLIPSVILEADITIGFEPLNVYFTCHASNFSGDVLSYDFDFGPSNIVQETASISHVFEGPGVYSVTVTVTDIYGTNASDSIDITVNEKVENSNLEADFSYYNTSAFEYFFIGSALNGDGDYSYEWDFEYDPEESFNPRGSGASASWSYSTMSIYIVRLIVTDGEGNTDTRDTVIGVGF